MPKRASRQFPFLHASNIALPKQRLSEASPLGKQRLEQEGNGGPTNVARCPRSDAPN